jgi:hypothetical protein
MRIELLGVLDRMISVLLCDTQLFVTANNASSPKLSLDCIDQHCDYAPAFIGNIWQDSIRKLLEQESAELCSTEKEFYLVKACGTNYLRKLFPLSQFVFVARDEGRVMGEAVPALHAEGMDIVIVNDGSRSESSASDGRGAAGRAPALLGARRRCWARAGGDLGADPRE